MPRRNTGPRLCIKRPKGYPEPFWHIRWHDGYTRLKSTGVPVSAPGGERQAEAALADFIAQRAEIPEGPSHPSQITVGTVLTLYAELHAPSTADPARIAYCNEALMPFWKDRPVSDVLGENCRAYRRRRNRDGIGDGTVERELANLAAALNFAHAEGFLTSAPKVTKPPRPPARDRWLTREEAAALLRTARVLVRHGGGGARQRLHHLTLAILIGLYTGTRPGAVMKLQWAPNPGGGHNAKPKTPPPTPESKGKS